MPVRVVAALVRKDLQIFFSDRRAALLTVAIPIAIASFFGFVFGGQSDQAATRVRVAVVDHDGSAMAKALLAGLAGDAALTVTQPSLDQARAEVTGGRLPVAVIIPEGFGEAAARAFLTQTARPQLELLTDPSKAPEVSMVKGILTGHVMEAVGQEAFGGEQGRKLVDEGLRTLDSSGMAAEQRELLRRVMQAAQALYRAQDNGSASVRRPMSVPFEIKEDASTGPARVPYNGYAHAFAGMGIQFALFAAIDFAAGILLERERGLWKRLRSAPLSRTTLLVARSVSGTIITLMTLLVSFGFARLVFKVPIGNLAGFLAVTVASALMAATLGLLVAAVGSTPAATRRVAIFVVLVMVMLGGAWVPSFLFPAWLQTITEVIPVRWAVDGLDAMTWRGLAFSEVLLPFGLILAFSLACGAAALWLFRWEEA